MFPLTLYLSYPSCHDFRMNQKYIGVPFIAKTLPFSSIFLNPLRLLLYLSLLGSFTACAWDEEEDFGTLSYGTSSHGTSSYGTSSYQKKPTLNLLRQSNAKIGRAHV